MLRPWLPVCLLTAALGCNDHRYGFFGNEEGSGGESSTGDGAWTTVSPTAPSTLTTPDPTSPDPTLPDPSTTTPDPSGPGTITATSPSTVTTDPTGSPGQCGEEPLPPETGLAVVRDNTGLADVFVHSCAGSGGPDLIYVWTAPFDGVFEFDTVQSEIDTVLSVYDGYCGGFELGCNDDDLQLWSRVQAKLLGGTTVTIVIDGVGGQVGPIRLNIDVAEDVPPPPPPPACVPVDIGSALGSLPISTTGSVNALASACGGEAGDDMKMVWTPPFVGAFRFETSGSGFDPLLSVRADGSCEGVELACNDDFVGQEARIELFVDPASGPLLLVLDSVGVLSGDTVLAITEL